jgi:predicted RNase H-like nuclease (RuvC/YqgF family)
MSDYKHIYNSIDNAMRHIQQAQEYCGDAMHLDKESCGTWKKQLKEIEKQVKSCYRNVETKHKKASLKKEEKTTIEKQASRLKKFAEDNQGTIYQQKGYKDRDDYLTQLAEEYDLDEYTVFSLADMLGPNEDFDGLINALEDAADFF